jgi:hypothetical protein
MHPLFGRRFVCPDSRISTLNSHPSFFSTLYKTNDLVNKHGETPGLTLAHMFCIIPPDNMKSPFAMHPSKSLTAAEHEVLGFVRLVEGSRMKMGSTISQLVLHSFRKPKSSTRRPLFARFHNLFRVPSTAHISMSHPYFRRPLPYLLPRRTVVPLRFNPRFATRLCRPSISIFSNE